MAKADTIKELEELGIEFNKRSSASDLTEILEEAKEALKNKPIEVEAEIVTEETELKDFIEKETQTVKGKNFSNLLSQHGAFVCTDGKKFENVYEAAEHEFTLS